MQRRKRWCGLGLLLGALLLPSCGDKARAPQASTNTKPPASVAASQASTKPAASQASVVKATSQAVPGAGCLALQQAWRSKLVGDKAATPEDEAALAERASQFECSLQLDLDGDQRLERVSIIAVKTQLGIGLDWGDGHHSVLGAGQPPAAGQEVLSEFSWLVRWKVVPKTSGGFSMMIAGKPHVVQAPDALGDGIMLDGGDAASILYWSAAGWRLLELGF